MRQDQWLAGVLEVNIRTVCNNGDTEVDITFLEL